MSFCLTSFVSSMPTIVNLRQGHTRLQEFGQIAQHAGQSSLLHDAVRRARRVNGEGHKRLTKGRCTSCALLVASEIIPHRECLGSPSPGLLIRVPEDLQHLWSNVRIHIPHGALNLFTPTDNCFEASAWICKRKNQVHEKDRREALDDLRGWSAAQRQMAAYAEKYAQQNKYTGSISYDPIQFNITRISLCRCLGAVILFL